VEGAAGDAAERAEDGRRAKVWWGAAGPLLTLRFLAGRRAQRRESCECRARIRSDLLFINESGVMHASWSTSAVDQFSGKLISRQHIYQAIECFTQYLLELAETARSTDHRSTESQHPPKNRKHHDLSVSCTECVTAR